MTVIVDFLDKNIDSIKMEGPHVDYQFGENLFFVTSDKLSGKPEKRITIPVNCILKVTEYNN